MTTAANGEGGETTQPWWLVLLEGILPPSSEPFF